MTGTCYGGLGERDHSITSVVGMIANTIKTVIKPKEFVELEPCSLSPGLYLPSEIPAYYCISDDALLSTLRLLRDRGDVHQDNTFLDFSPADAFQFFGKPGTCFWTSRFIGCTKLPQCTHCRAYTSIPIEVSFNALVDSFNLLAPASELMFLIGSDRKLISDRTTGVEILWSLPGHVWKTSRNPVIFSLVKITKGKRECQYSQ